MSDNGVIHRRRVCEKCGKDTLINSRYDAAYCPHCNIWTEKGCSDPECEFCKDRPDKPLEE